MATLEQLETDGLGTTFAAWETDTVRTDPLRILSTVAACIDTAEIMAERGEIDTAEIDDTARVIGYRIMSRAVREQRAAHTWWTDPAGDASPVAPAPEPFERVRSARKTRRTNSGRTETKVTAHGRAYVVGLLDGARPNRHAAMSVARITAALDTAPRTVNGRDAISVSRLTDAIYPDLPRLIGADTVSFEEWGAWDETRARTPRRGHGARYGLPAVWARNGEITAPRPSMVDLTAVDVPAWEPCTVAALLAPDADPAYAWRGYVRHVRPETVRDVAAAAARPVDERLAADPMTLAEDLLTIATACPDTWRATFAAGDHDGVLTVRRGKKNRYRVTGLPADPDIDVRTPEAMAHRVAAAVAAGL